MLLLILAQTVWGLSLAGLGDGIVTAARRRIGDSGAPWGLGECGLFGLVALAYLGLLVNFAAGIGPAIAVGLWALGIVGLALRFRRVGALATRAELVAGALLVVGHAFFAVCVNFNFDTGYYHVPTIRWAQAEPVVRGLANLCPWFGYNSTAFIAESVLALPGLGWTGSFACTPLVATFFFLELFHRLASGRLRAGSLAWALSVLALLVANRIDAEMGMVSPNVVARLFLLYAWLLCLEALESPSLDPTVAPRVVLASLFAVTAKIFALGALGANLALLVLVVGRAGFRGAPARRAVRLSAIVAALLLLPWVARSALLSGCLLFPQRLTCFPALPWAVPESSLAAVVDGITRLNGGALTSAARAAGPAAALGRVVSGVVAYHASQPILLVSLAIFLAGLVFHRGRGCAVVLVALGANLAGMAFVVAFAPSGSFLIHHWVIEAALLLGYVARGVRWPVASIRRAAPALVALALVLDVRTAALTRGGPVAWVRWPIFPVPATREVPVTGGAVVHVAPARLCWDHAPPCVEEIPDGMEGSRDASGHHEFRVTESARIPAGGR